MRADWKKKDCFGCVWSETLYPLRLAIRPGMWYDIRVKKSIGGIRMPFCSFAESYPMMGVTPVENLFIQSFLPQAPGDYVRVYLYGLMQCRYPSMCDRPLHEALGISEQAVTEAFCYWQEQGLVRIVSDQPLTVEYREIGTRSAGDALPAKYASLVRQIYALTAPRQFGVSELKHVYDWIEVYNLEEGAVLELNQRAFAMGCEAVSGKGGAV